MANFENLNGAKKFVFLTRKNYYRSLIIFIRIILMQTYEMRN